MRKSLTARLPRFRKRAHPAHAASLSACALALGVATGAGAQIFDFTIDPGQSGLQGALSFTVPTSGTLIGNWDPASNPGGTRTKPGVFGPFGPTENIAVPVSASLDVGGPINSSTSGLFQFTIDPGSGSASISGYTANLLHSGSLGLPVVLNLLYESFRTRGPDSTFIGGIALPIPLGEASLTQFSIQQLGGGSGTLLQTGPNEYSFQVIPIVQLTAEFTAMGMPFQIPGAPTPLPLAGSITVMGEDAVLSWVRSLQISEQQPINQPLPQFAFDLPTLLPPGGTAHLLMNLTVGTVTADVDAMDTTWASGVLVPAPGAGSLLFVGSVGLLRRRRRDTRG